ncbi:MAG: hypothetical protein IH599_01600, partial [Bacteroidales bacterium]|nr:hypothetical protein [Bacteroidales bacterium]
MEEIAFLLEAIVEQTETIGRHGGKIPQIELDLVKENLRKLYEAYHRLDKDNAGEDVGTVVVPEVRTTLQPAPRPEPPPAREDPPAPPLVAATPLTPAQTDTSPQRAPEPQRSEADLLFDEMI